jgi:hypothetical protein
MFAARQLLTRTGGALRPSAVVVAGSRRAAAVQVSPCSSRCDDAPARSPCFTPKPLHTHIHAYQPNKIINQQPPTQVVRRNMGGHGAAPPATGWEGEVRKVLKEDWQVRLFVGMLGCVGRGIGV